MAIVAHSSLISAQSGAVKSRKADEQHQARNRQDAAAAHTAKAKKAEQAGQRAAPVDRVEIRKSTDHKQEIQARIAKQTAQRQQTEHRADSRRAEHTKQDRHRAEMRQEAAQRREAPRAHVKRHVPPGSKVNVSA